MKQQSHEGRPGILLTVVAVALLALMAGQIRFGPWVRTEGAILRLLSPVLTGIDTAIRWSAEGIGYVTGGASPARVRELEREVARLEVERQRLEEQGLENGRLRALLGLRQSLPIPSVGASVLSNSVRGLGKTCIIDRGSSSGLEPGMSVVNTQGVVGRLLSVAPGISKVQLLTDASSGVAVLDQRSRVQGVLTGRGDRVLELRYVSTLDDVRPMDLLLTSGLDGIYPRGLPVGVVAEAGQGGADLQRSITVVPRVEFDRLEELLVLLRSDLPLDREEAAP
jgi:rod shape-determining protein MreC